MENRSTHFGVTDLLVIVTISLLIGQVVALTGWYLLGVVYSVLFCTFIGRSYGSLILIVIAITLGYLEVSLLDYGRIEEVTKDTTITGRVGMIIKPGTPGERIFTVNTTHGEKLRCSVKDLPWRNVIRLKPGVFITARGDISPTPKTKWGRSEVRRGYSGRCKVRYLGVSEEEDKGFFVTVREALDSKVQTLTSPDEKGGIVRGVLLGKRDGISTHLERGFQRFGIAHLLVVSGLHVGFLYWVISLVVREVTAPVAIHLGFYTFPKFFAPLFGLLLAWFYILLLGFPLSALRAGIALTILALGDISERKGGFMKSLVFSIFILISLWPGVFEELGFQLTYGALIGIYLGIKITRGIRPGFFGKIKSTAIVSTLPTLTTGILLYLSLGKFTPLAPLGNLILSPLILTVVFFGGLLALSLSMVSLPLGKVVIDIVERLTEVLRELLV